VNHKGNIKFPNLLQSRESISNRERGGERGDLLKGCLARRTLTYRNNMSQNRDVVTSLTSSVYKMCAKLKKEGLQHTSLFMP
jgi:hypothetical protein